jgi:hypothetical protein
MDAGGMWPPSDSGHLFVCWLCCAGIALATVIVSYLADVALQIYLRQAMQKLYTGVCLRRAQ